MFGLHSLKFLLLSLCLLVSTYCLVEQKFMMEISNHYNTTNLVKIADEILNVRCYWIKGWNVYDVSGLEKSGTGDWNFTTSEGSIIYYNFCANTRIQCKNTSNSSMIVGYDSLNSCKRLAGDELSFNKFSLLNSTDANGGLSIQFSSGEACPDGSGFYTVTFDLLCDPTMQKGEIQFFNEKEFSLKKCKNKLQGKTFEACPKVNYYLIEYFLSQNSSYLGAVIIILGVFLVLFGVKFLKVTTVIVSILACLTLAVVLFFNVFQATSTQIVWIVMGVGAVMGLALGILFIKLTNGFFMLMGGYVGYVVAIFLYDVFLQYIHADPKVVYWVTIVGCIVVCSLLTLWLVKHALIFATSICGAYGVIRGASIYIGHFPNESKVIDLIQHDEFDQLQQLLDTDLYIYLSFWAVLAIFGIWFQYRANSDKNSDDYRKM